MILAIAGHLSGPRLQALWGRLDETQQLAVRETLHDPRARFRRRPVSGPIRQVAFRLQVTRLPQVVASAPLSLPHGPLQLADGDSTGLAETPVGVRAEAPRSDARHHRRTARRNPAGTPVRPEGTRQVHVRDPRAPGHGTGGGVRPARRVAAGRPGPRRGQRQDPARIGRRHAAHRRCADGGRFFSTPPKRRNIAGARWLGPSGRSPGPCYCRAADWLNFTVRSWR